MSQNRDVAGTIGKERRAHERRGEVRPCKLFNERTRRYVVAQTCDVCDGGVRVQVLGDRGVEVGQRVKVAVAEPGRVVVRGGELREGEVVRSEAGLYGVQTVAVRFDEPVAVGLAA